jgi:hypothetical protein
MPVMAPVVSSSPFAAQLPPPDATRSSKATPAVVPIETGGYSVPPDSWEIPFVFLTNSLTA